ncbi:MAG: sugar phosphate nucleotidyltransferase [Thermoplasmata archaeon]
MKVVILAGGKGTRLLPYTTVYPKPLVPIGDRPILEILIRQLAKNGFDEIILAVGHLAELIQAFFGDGSKYGIKIEYSKEDKPLGTAAPILKIRDKLNETFIMMNGDILTTLDFSALVHYHQKNKAAATVALNKRDVNIDYGVVEVDSKQNIHEWKEKPKISYNVSMGVYVLEPEVLDYVPQNQPYDLPELIRDLINNNKIVKGYLYDGYWLDIGRPEDYKKAVEEKNPQELIEWILKGKK